MPGGVWAQSISASEFEVSWQTLSDSPERVLGYEVRLSALLNGNDSASCFEMHHGYRQCLSSPTLHLFFLSAHRNINKNEAARV